MKIRTILLLLCAHCFGCAFGGTRRKDFDRAFARGSEINDVVWTLGVPDRHIKLGNRDYLTYRRTEGWHVWILGASSITERDLLFEDGRLAGDGDASQGGTFRFLLPGVERF